MGMWLLGLHGRHMGSRLCALLASSPLCNIINHCFPETCSHKGTWLRTCSPFLELGGRQAALPRETFGPSSICSSMEGLGGVSCFSPLDCDHTADVRTTRMDLGPRVPCGSNMLSFCRKEAQIGKVLAWGSG
jgi:hypothetical protein